MDPKIPVWEQGQGWPEALRLYLRKLISSIPWLTILQKVSASHVPLIMFTTWAGHKHMLSAFGILNFLSTTFSIWIFNRKLHWFIQNSWHLLVKITYGLDGLVKKEPSSTGLHNKLTSHALAFPHSCDHKTISHEYHW